LVVPPLHRSTTNRIDNRQNAAHAAAVDLAQHHLATRRAATPPSPGIGNVVLMQHAMHMDPAGNPGDHRGFAIRMDAETCPDRSLDQWEMLKTLRLPRHPRRWE